MKFEITLKFKGETLEKIDTPINNKIFEKLCVEQIKKHINPQVDVEVISVDLVNG